MTHKNIPTPTEGARPPAEHHLKTWPAYFRQLKNGRKRFEFRKDDRGFAEGDTLVLHEWGGEKMEYTGDSLTFKVGYIARGVVVPDGYCIMQLEAEAAPAAVPQPVEEHSDEAYNFGGEAAIPAAPPRPLQEIEPSDVVIGTQGYSADDIVAYPEYATTNPPVKGAAPLQGLPRPGCITFTLQVLPDEIKLIRDGEIVVEGSAMGDLLKAILQATEELHR